MMKKTLICVKNKGCKAIVSAMSELSESFKKLPREENLLTTETDCKHRSLSRAETESSETSTYCSLSLLKTNTTTQELPPFATGGIEALRGLSQEDSQNCSASKSSRVSLSQTEENGQTSKSFSVKISRDEEVYSDVNSLKDRENVVSREKEVVDDEEGESEARILDVIEEIIRKATFKSIPFDTIEIPKELPINRELVNKIKDLLQHTPDKTQCFVGVVRLVDENDHQVGDYKIWVNVELYLAKLELEMENTPEENTNEVFAVVHTVFVEDDIKSDVVGVFLNKNSIEFSAKLHEKMTYQDLVRMCCITLNADKSDRSKVYLRSSLRNFSKGNKNATLFIDLASQSVKFLNMFEKFMRLYEEGSVFGQGLSLQHLADSKNKKKDQVKLEVPLTLLRLHVKVNPVLRDQLLLKLLGKKISFSEYRISLEKQCKLVNLKAKVEKIAGQPFENLKESYPSMMSDDVLEDFVEAKTQNSGHNAHYTNLVKHVNLVVNGKTTPELDPPPMFDFVDSDKMGLLDVSLKLRQYDLAVLCLSSMNENFNKAYLFAWKEHLVKNPNGIGVFVENETDLRSDMDDLFSTESEIQVEYVFIKFERPIQSGGFIKNYGPVAVVGRQEVFKDKQINTFHHSEIEVALPIILSNILDAKTKVLYAFEDLGHGIDLDPVGGLCKRKITVTYLSKKEVLQPFVKMLKAKIV